ncbi:eukaryotic translation initiation factor 3 subunit C-like [Rhopilema esculentum]|uniref:eukaryotic translation initiation factor 3 subunit C-like n=1 Tax=Rhopilema esculentum TaxID=499914 RepID=UPI0031DA2337|eukprot:gene12654-3361_t
MDRRNRRNPNLSQSQSFLTRNRQNNSRMPYNGQPFHPVIYFGNPMEHNCLMAFQDPRFQENAQTTASSNGAASENEQDLGKLKKKRTEWSEESTKYLLQLWADNYNYLNSAHSRKAWKKIVQNFNKTFDTERTFDQIKRKVKYHIEKYKTVCEWNKSQSGGQNKDCDFFEVIDGVLGTGEVVNFPYVVGAGVENENSDDQSQDVPDPETTYLILGEKDTPFFAVKKESDLVQEESPREEAPFTLFEHTLETVEPRGPEKNLEAAKSPHIDSRHERKRKRKGRVNEDEKGGDGEKKLELALAKMTAQSEQLVNVAERMEQNSRRQTEILEQLSRGLCAFMTSHTRDKMPRLSTRRRKRPENLQMQSDSDENEIY